MKVITRYYFQQARLWDEDGHATGPIFEISKHRFEKGNGKKKGDLFELPSLVPVSYDERIIERLGARRVT